MKQLTDTECNYFRKQPYSFNDMLREVYRAGYKAALKDCGHVPINPALTGGGKHEFENKD